MLFRAEIRKIWIFLNLCLIGIKAKAKAKTTTRKNSNPGFGLASQSCMKNQANFIRIELYRAVQEDNRIIRLRKSK